MLDATKKKLREARFFLSYLEREEHAPNGSSIPEAAEFFFSAFVSAARSVTFAFQNEERERYTAWTPGWFQARSTSEQLLLARFKEERTQALKRTGSDLATNIVLIPAARITHTNTPLAAQMLWWGESVPEIGAPSLRCRFAHDGIEVAAVPAAREYLQLLDQLVTEFLACYEQDSLTSA